MSDSNAPNEHNSSSVLTETIAVRLELGRQTLSHANGAIVPMPPESPSFSVLNCLTGKDLEKVEKWKGWGYQPTVYDYCSAEGDVTQKVLRFDHATRPKEIRPVRCIGYNGKKPKLWLSAIDGQRPLYASDQLEIRPAAPVLVVEGEKTAEAAKPLFPDHVVITWMGGSGGVARTEMNALADRWVTIWPDNDEPGRKAGRRFASLALEAGAARVSIVDVPSEFPEKWDLADPAPGPVDAYGSLRHMLETARPVTAQDVATTSMTVTRGAERRRLLGHKPGYSRVKPEYVAHALAQLDPAMGREQWIRIARCVYFALGDKGLEIFDEWSKRCTAKYRAGEPASMWSAFAAETGFQAQPLSRLFADSMKAAKAQQKNAELNDEAVALAHVEELNESYAFVMRGGKATIAWERFDPRFGRYELDYLPKQDFEAKFIWRMPLPLADDRVSPKKKHLSLGTYWFTSLDRRAYDAVYFSPGKNVGKYDLNLWRGFAVDPVDNPNGWAKFKAHLLNHVAGGDQASFDYIMNWLAFGVQQLAEPVGTALVLIGPKGAGKSIVTEIYGYLFGPHKFVTAHAEDLFGRFNARLEWTLLLGIEEAFAPQNRSADGKLKDLITRQELRVEDKFFSVWTAPNHLRVIMTSNNDRVVSADGFERRYAVFNVESPFQADPDARRAYFGALVQEMESGGYEAMLGELLARDINGWNREAIPETPALRRQKELSIGNHPVKAWLYERLCDGEFISEGDPKMDRRGYRWSATETVNVRISHLRDDFLAFTKANNLPFSDRMLALKLPELMPAGFKSIVTRDPSEIDGDPFKAYPFPPLQEARAAFTAATGFAFPAQ